MKRTSDKGHLSKEDYESQVEDEEEAGVYKKASAETISARRIVKPAKKFANVVKSNAAPVNMGNSTSVFGKLPSYQPARPTGQSKFESKDVPMGINIVKPPVSTSGAIKSSDSNTSTSKMHKLNMSFIAWMEKQMISHSVSNWTAGLHDYIKHAEKISDAPVEDAKPVSSSFGSFQKPASSSAENAPPSKPSTFGSFQKPAFSSAENVPPSKPSTFGSFQKPASSTTSVKPNFGAGGSSISTKTTTSAAETSTKSGGFGMFSTAASTTSVTNKPGLATFKKSEDSQAALKFGGFGKSATSNGSSTTTANEEYEGEPILEPEKIYKNENDLDEILYETDCKAFRFDTDGKEWKECGKGSLRITKEPGVEKKRVLVRNTLGKITINAYIFKGMKFKMAGKSGMQFMAVVDASGVPQSFLVKVKASEIGTTFDKFTKAAEEAK